MSIEALSIVLNHSKASGAVKLVLIGIANHINPDNDGAWPSQEKLAHYANCSDRYVRDAIQLLSEMGELRYESHGGRGRGDNYKPNRYWLLLTCPPDCDGTTNHRPRPELSAQMELSDTQGGTLSHLEGKPSSAEPLTKTIKETIKTKQSIATHMPDDWQPNDAIKQAFQTDFFALDLKIEANKFRTRNKAKGTKYKDWDMAFTNWCWNALSYLPADVRQPKKNVGGW